jgi:REP element-mobilizing transposase RayT
VVNGASQWSEFGTVVWAYWNDLPNHHPHIKLDAFVIMPNHVHGILRFVDLETSARRHALPEIVRGLKTYSARDINRLLNQQGIPIWQRSFYDHVIRNEQDLMRIREYIETNPLKWELDHENPNSPKS